MAVKTSILSALALSLLVSSTASAQQTRVTVNLTSEGQRLAQFMSMTDADLVTMMEGAVSDLYGLTDLDALLGRAANGQSIANHNLGVDYASDPSVFVVGVGGAGARGVDNSLTVDGKNYDHAFPLESAQVGFMLGFSLNAVPGLNLPLLLTVNAISVNIDPENDWAVSNENYGFHAQYKVLDGMGWSWAAKWSGLFVTTGFEYSKLQLSINGDLDYKVGLGTNGIELQTKSRGTARITQIANTIPIEVSSAFTAAYVFTFYGAAGIDLQLGESKLDANLDTTIDDNYTNSQSATANIVTEKTSSASAFAAHAMLGLQLNLSLLKVYGQFAYATTGEYAFAAGLRVAY